MWSAGSSRGTALEHREWQPDAADNVRLDLREPTRTLTSHLNRTCR